jgi:hypothetical protein
MSLSLSAKTTQRSEWGGRQPTQAKEALMHPFFLTPFLKQKKISYFVFETNKTNNWRQKLVIP